MSDSEWLQQNKHSHSKPPSVTPATSTSEHAPVKAHPGVLVIGLAIIMLAGYGYLSKSHLAEQAQPQQTVKPAAAQQRVPTAAEAKARDDQNQRYLKQIEDDYYRKQISGDILKLNDIASRFNDVNQVAASTARIALPQLVQQMQALRREVTATATHQCLTPAAKALGAAISEIINGYLAFMQNGNDAEAAHIKPHIEAARAYLDQYVKQRDSCLI